MKLPCLIGTNAINAIDAFYAMTESRGRSPRDPPRDAAPEAGLGVHLQEDAKKSRGYLSSKGTSVPEGCHHAWLPRCLFCRLIIGRWVMIAL